MNIELLEKIKKQILEEPRQFIMTSFFVKNHPLDREKIPNCGTAACIAGWALAISSNKNPKQCYDSITPPIALSTPSQAQTLLDIPNGNLFYVDGWPFEFQKEWYFICNKQERAKVAVRVIDDYIKTNGWKE